MREDLYTNTEADAGRYERFRADEDRDPDLPTPSELEDEGCCPNAAVARARFCGCGGAA